MHDVSGPVQELWSYLTMHLGYKTTSKSMKLYTYNHYEVSMCNMCFSGSVQELQIYVPFDLENICIMAFLLHGNRWHGVLSQVEKEFNELSKYYHNEV